MERTNNNFGEQVGTATLTPRADYQSRAAGATSAGGGKRQSHRGAPPPPRGSAGDEAAPADRQAEGVPKSTLVPLSD